MCVCAHSAPESNTASSSLRSGNFKTPFSWAVGLGKNVNVISQTVRTCMQIPCTYEALFTVRLFSVPQPQLSALTRHSGNRSWRYGSGCGILADLHYRAPTRQRACVHARTQYIAHSLPTLIVMTFLRLRLLLVRPEKSICRVLQIPSRPRRWPKASLWSVNRDWQRHDAGHQTV